MRNTQKRDQLCWSLFCLSGMQLIGLSAAIRATCTDAGDAARVFLLWKYVRPGLTRMFQSAILTLSIENCESIEVRCTSVHRPLGTGIPDGGKGKSPKRILLPGQICWFVGEYLPDCHESGALSFLSLDHWSVAVNVGAIQDSRFSF